MHSTNHIFGVIIIAQAIYKLYLLIIFEDVQQLN